LPCAERLVKPPYYAYSETWRHLMSDIAQVDRIMTEVTALGERERVLLFQKIGELIDPADEEDVPVESVFGIWKDRDITLENIRQKAWRQK
jgi:hypothetical protein